MLTNPDGPFINLSRLNLAKYAQKPKLAKVCKYLGDFCDISFLFSGIILV